MANLGSAFHDALQTHDAMHPKRALWKKWLWSSVGVSVVVMVVTAALLWAINPPMVQTKGGSGDLERPTRDVGKVAGWSVAAGVVVLVGPLIYNWVTKEPAAADDAAAFAGGE